MGVGAHGLIVVTALLAAAWLTHWLESLLTRGGSGPGRTLITEAMPVLPNRDRWLFPVGPAFALIGVFLGSIVIPLGPGLIAQDLGIGLFYFIVVLDFVVLGVALSGWGANTNNAVEAYYRIVAQLVSYVVPLGLALVGAIMMAKSLSTVSIVEAQSKLWFIVLQPLGFLLYLVTGLMLCYRAPFFEAFAQDIGGGVLGVTGGWTGLLWRAALSGMLFLVSAMGAVLFLGGWLGPWLPGPVWMLLKTFSLMALMLLIGRKVQPMSTAQMLALSWKILIPIGMVNVLIVGGLILLHIGPA